MLGNNFRHKRSQVAVTWTTYKVMNYMICTPHQKYSGDQIKKDVVSGSCDRRGGREINAEGIVVGIPEGNRPPGRTTRR